MTARIITDYWPKPIALRWYNWSATYDDYDANDGAPDSGNRGHIGHGATEAQAVIDLIENHPRGIQCHEQERQCRSCVHFQEKWSRAHDGADDCQTVCGLHRVNGGWHAMPTDAESSCSDHEFDGERDMARTVFLPKVEAEEIAF